MRLYTPGQLSEMLEEAGFESPTILGNLAGDELTLDCFSLVVVARKPSV